MARQHEFDNGACVHCTRPENQSKMACRLPKGVAKPEQEYKAKVTPSLVAAIMGMSPSMKRAEALRIMVRKEIDQPDEFQSNVVTQYNDACKETALEELTASGRDWVESEDWFKRGPCAVKPLMVYDYDLAEWGILILRTPYGKRDGSAMDDANDIDHLWARTQFELLVTGLPWADVYQWSHMDNCIDRMTLDPKFVEQFDNDLPGFMEEFKKGVRYPNDFIEPAVPIIETEQATTWAQQWEDVLQQEQNVKDKKEELLEEARKIAKDKPSLIGGKRLIRTERNGSTSWGKIIAELKVEIPQELKDKHTGSGSTTWSIK